MRGRVCKHKYARVNVCMCMRGHEVAAAEALHSDLEVASKEFSWLKKHTQYTNLMMLSLCLCRQTNRRPYNPGGDLPG